MEKFLELLLDFKKRIERLEKAFKIYVQPWTAVTFQNSWVNYDATYNQCAYLRDPNGFVHLRGLVKTGTVGVATPIFTLPAGYRPQYIELFSTISNAALGRVDVLTDGKVAVNVGNNTWVSLDGLTFKAYQ